MRVQIKPKLLLFLGLILYSICLVFITGRFTDRTKQVIVEKPDELHSFKTQARPNFDKSSSSYIVNNRSRFHKTLSQGSNAIKEALSQTSDADDMAAETQKLFMEAWHVAKTTGDFEPIKNLFSAIDQKERYQLSSMLPSVFSKFGPEYDLAQKREILNSIIVEKDSFDRLERSIYQAEAKERYDEMKQAGIITDLKPEIFSSVIQAVGEIRLGVAFERINDSGSEEARRLAAIALSRYAMKTGTMEASEEIAKLEPGIIRDEAVAEMVIWMNRTGSADQVLPWLETIHDPIAKARATPKPKPSQ